MPATGDTRHGGRKEVFYFIAYSLSKKPKVRDLSIRWSRARQDRLLVNNAGHGAIRGGGG